VHLPADLAAVVQALFPIRQKLCGDEHGIMER
jgi:hypothetical protein